jgi:hypothetical protein
VRRKDYADRIEALAALNDMDPLEVLEWFNERAAIREEGNTGMTRAEAERLAILDLEEWLS